MIFCLFVEEFGCDCDGRLALLALNRYDLNGTGLIDDSSCTEKIFFKVDRRDYKMNERSVDEDYHTSTVFYLYILS